MKAGPQNYFQNWQPRDYFVAAGILMQASDIPLNPGSANHTRRPLTLCSLCPKTKHHVKLHVKLHVKHAMVFFTYNVWDCSSYVLMSLSTFFLYMHLLLLLLSLLLLLLLLLFLLSLLLLLLLLLQGCFVFLFRQTEFITAP